MEVDPEQTYLKTRGREKAPCTGTWDAVASMLLYRRCSGDRLRQRTLLAVAGIVVVRELPSGFLCSAGSNAAGVLAWRNRRG